MTDPASPIARPPGFIRRTLHGVVVIVAAVACTLGLFLVLPVIQAINKPPQADLLVQAIDVALPPPPPPPPEEEKKEEEEPEDKPPELKEQMEPLDLSMLEMALNTDLQGGWMSGDFGVRLGSVIASAEDTESIFSMSDLDERPRLLHSPAPVITAKMRSRTPGSVVVIFQVDESGRVVTPIVEQSSDLVFESAVLSVLKQWKYEPGKRGGESVRFRVRQPFSFPRN